MAEFDPGHRPRVVVALLALAATACLLAIAMVTAAPVEPNQGLRAAADPHQPVPTRTRRPLVRPPRALLEVDGIEQEAGIGTYCWPEAGCVDYFTGMIAPADPLRTDSPLVGSLTFPPDEAPTHIRLRTYRYDDQRGRPTYDDWAFWPYEDGVAVGPNYELPLLREQPLQLVREPGLYVVRVGVWYEDADVFYGFLVEVE